MDLESMKPWIVLVDWSGGGPRLPGDQARAENPLIFCLPKGRELVSWSRALK